MRDLIGRTLGHYRIVEKIGEGGMGEVYKAHDERLDRDVAVKVLPEAVAADAQRLARFEREAKAVAKLEHPNILAIYDFGTDEDVTYSVTELLEGETLRERLEGGALGWRKAVEIAAAIADSLGAAHDAGIVHRDLKPENVFITLDSRVKVLDFGLAKVEEGPIEDLDTVTSPSPGTLAGTVLGTVGYMAPEQVRGREADSRSDIFALGCVLFEMISACAPFRSDTAMDTMAAILNQDPPDLSTHCRGLPQSTGDIVRRCLEKRPEARFQSGRDLAFALRSTLQDRVEAAGRAGPDEKSIVVLPFENLSPDPDQEFFADGLTEEVISDLAKVRAIRVISRTSAMQLKGTDKDLRTIGGELNVRYVLEGSVRRAGDALKITAQLIDVLTDTHVWADKYAGILEDVFEIQEKVSRAIVQALEIRLTPQEDRKIAERPTEDVKAYECYLRARSEMLRGPEECLERALRMLEVGLDTFGGNVLLFTGIAEVYLQYYEYGIDTDDKILRNADRFARKVSELSPDSAEGHYLAGRIERFRGTALNAVRCFEQAFRANPDNIQNMLFLGHTYSHQLGQQRMAKPFMRRLAEIDPLTPLSLFALTMHRMITGNLDGAFDSCQKIFRLEPENWFSRLWAVYILLWQGKIDQALHLIEEVLQSRAENHAIQWCRFLELVLRGEKNEALGKLPEDTRLFFWNDPETPYLGADVFALMDEKDKALDWIEHAINRGWINYPLFAHDDPLLENVRGERRFHDLMERIKPEWDAFEAGIDLNSLPWVEDSR